MHVPPGTHIQVWTQAVWNQVAATAHSCLLVLPPPSILAQKGTSQRRTCGALDPSGQQSHMHICMHGCVSACVRVHAQVCVFVHVYAHVCMDVCLFMLVCALQAGPHLPAAWLHQLFCSSAAALPALPARHLALLAWGVACLQTQRQQQQQQQQEQEQEQEGISRSKSEGTTQHADVVPLRRAVMPGAEDGSGIQQASLPGPEDGSGMQQAPLPGAEDGSGMQQASLPGAEGGSGMQQAPLSVPDMQASCQQCTRWLARLLDVTATRTFRQADAHRCVCVRARMSTCVYMPMCTCVCVRVPRCACMCMYAALCSAYPAPLLPEHTHTYQSANLPGLPCQPLIGLDASQPLLIGPFWLRMLLPAAWPC